MSAKTKDALQLEEMRAHAGLMDAHAELMKAQTRLTKAQAVELENNNSKK